MLAHQLLDGIHEISSFVPGILDETRIIQERFLPWLPPSSHALANDEDEDAPEYIERFRNRIAAGHEVIDTIFSTDYANRFSEEAKTASKENFAYGILPPPQLGVIESEALLIQSERIPITLATDRWGWSVGEEITNRTAFGSVPKWSTVRKRYWKNQADKIQSDPNFRSEYANPENIKRMENGLAPQVFNDRNGQMESIELHHIPSQRQGGLFDFIEVTQDEHASIDKFRYLGGKGAKF